MQKLPPAVTGDMAVSDTFPAGLRVLVVDCDIKCLRGLETMLRNCKYRVTTCSQATVALDLLHKKKYHFDVVLSDVHLPDMDGFRLLELVGLEMDLPVIMMSRDARTSFLLRGIQHGACDYLIKPIREEELKKIWQHVVRKRWIGNKEQELSGVIENNDRHKQGSDNTEYHASSSVNEGMEGMLKNQKKKRDVKEEDDGELENDDLTAPKRPRVVWAMELHEQFASAVNQLGIDKAVPKRILELMNMPGLTRENVASHLQKYRLYLKKISTEVTQQPEEIPNSFRGSDLEQSPNIYSYGRFDSQALTPSSARIPTQTLANMQAELLGHPTINPIVPQINHQSLLQGKLLRSKYISVDQHQPTMRTPQPIIVTNGAHSGFSAWPVSSNLGRLGAQNGCTIMSQNQKELNQSKQSIWPEPSCLIPSQTPATSQSGNGFTVNYNSSFITGKMSDMNLKLTGVVSGYNSDCPGPISPSISSVEHVIDGQHVQKSIRTHVHNMPDLQGYLYNGNAARLVFDQATPRNHGFVGKGASIPSRFEVYEPETGNLYQENYGDGGRKIKQQDLSGDFVENLDWESSL